MRQRRVMALAWAGLALAVALAACGGTTATPPRRAPQVMGATATPAPLLSWHALTLPAGVKVAAFISPADAREAWVCAPTGGPRYDIWRTRDEGVNWTQVSSLTPKAPQSQPISSCILMADQRDINAVAANFTWGVPNAATAASPQGSLSFYSADGGAHWKSMPADLWIERTASIGDMTYAMFLDTGSSQESLVASADHLTSWRTLAPLTQNARLSPDLFVAPAPGQPDQLLAIYQGGGASYSSDGGASWATVKPPDAGSVQETTAVWLSQSAAGASASGWLICGYLQVASALDPTQNLCTSTGGRAWTNYPVLANSWECGHCSQSAGEMSGTSPCLITAIGPAGALYAECGFDPQDSGATPLPWTISRIAPGATTWTDIGQSPCQNSLSLTQTGQAWCVSTSAGADATYILDQLP